jgi:hypothetical protein
LILLTSQYLGNFTFVVLPGPAITGSDPSGSAGVGSSSIPVAAGAAGGAGLLIIIVIVLVVLWTRRQREHVRKLEQQYGSGSADMSDEAVLARAQAIQQALQNKKRNAVPNLKWLQIPPVTFLSPPKTLDGMNKYLADFSSKELPRDSVVLESEIGAGEFGSVYSGSYKRPDGSKRTIAIKTLKDSGNEESRLKFLQEASIMIQFKHPKVVDLVGVVTKSEPSLICLEFMELGSLRSYLMSSLVFEQLTDVDLVRMACDVCSAMHYLCESGLVHRDLAARNVLVNKEFICKVCDFGLSQSASASNADLDDRIPVRWTAPEAVIHRQFSQFSDVWSYGILLWEMWSYGALPYKGWSNEQVTAQVTKGYRLPNPKSCSPIVYNLMNDCWIEDPQERPSFYDVFEQLLAVWMLLKPAASKYAHGEKRAYQRRGIQAEKTPHLEAVVDTDEDDMYDLGGDGGRIAAPKEHLELELHAHEEDDHMQIRTQVDDDADLYDLGL